MSIPSYPWLQGQPAKLYIVVLFPVRIWYFTMALTMEAKNDDWRSVNSWWWLHWSSCPLACYQLFYSFPWWKMMPWSNLGLGAGSSTSCLMSVDSKSCVVLSCRFQLEIGRYVILWQVGPRSWRAAVLQIFFMIYSLYLQQARPRSQNTNIYISTYANIYAWNNSCVSNI